MFAGTKKIEFFEERAKQAADEAQSATLENVRIRSLRAETAWREMARQAIETERAKALKAAPAI